MQDLIWLHKNIEDRLFVGISEYELGKGIQ